jgi:phosphohistidine phosphatase SixA
LMRHGATSGGAGDPAGFRLEDCATQRNLTEKGRADVKAAGDEMRAQKVPVGKILSSQWCRCRDTAALMSLGPVRVSETFNNAYTFSNRRDELTKGARAVIAAWKGPGVLIVVTHGANILPLTGFQPEEGEMVVVEPDPAPDGKLRVIGRIPIGS